MKELIALRIEQSITVKQALLKQSSALTTAADALVNAYKSGHKAMFFGNGGSAADAQHLAAELVGRYGFDRPALPALALTVNTSCLTAIGNDYSYDIVFARQIEALGVAGDVAVGITTSGNSANVLEAMAVAKRKNMFTIGLSGESGGKLKHAVDVCVCVPSTETARIQEAHIMIGHIWCELIERAMFS